MEELNQYVSGSNGEAPQRFYMSPEAEDFADFCISVKHPSVPEQRVKLPVHYTTLAMYCKMFMGLSDLDRTNFTHIEDDVPLAPVLVFLRILYDRTYKPVELDFDIYKMVVAFADKLDSQTVIRVMDDPEYVRTLRASSSSDIIAVANRYGLRRVSIWYYSEVMPRPQDFRSMFDVVKFIRSIGDDVDALRIAFMQFALRKQRYLPMDHNGDLSALDAEKLVRGSIPDLPESLVGKQYTYWFDVPHQAPSPYRSYGIDARHGEDPDLEKRYRYRSKTSGTNMQVGPRGGDDVFGLNILIRCAFVTHSECAFKITWMPRRHDVAGYRCFCTLHPWISGQAAEKTTTFTLKVAEDDYACVKFDVSRHSYVDIMGSFLVTLKMEPLPAALIDD